MEVNQTPPGFTLFPRRSLWIYCSVAPFRSAGTVEYSTGAGAEVSVLGTTLLSRPGVGKRSDSWATIVINLTGIVGVEVGGGQEQIDVN